jgi:hypothetical protein
MHCIFWEAKQSLPFLNSIYLTCIKFSTIQFYLSSLLQGKLPLVFASPVGVQPDHTQYPPAWEAILLLPSAVEVSLTLSFSLGHFQSKISVWCRLSRTTSKFRVGVSQPLKNMTPQIRKMIAISQRNVFETVRGGVMSQKSIISYMYNVLHI